MFDHKKTTTHAHKIEMDAFSIGYALTKAGDADKDYLGDDTPPVIPDNATLSTNAKGNLIIEWSEKVGDTADES